MNPLLIRRRGMMQAQQGGLPYDVGTVGYMYDRVSGQLFGNAGTGDFILGPDIQ